MNFNTVVFSGTNNHLNLEYLAAQLSLGFDLSARKRIFGGKKQLYFPTLGDSLSSLLQRLIGFLVPVKWLMSISNAVLGCTLHSAPPPWQCLPFPAGLPFHRFAAFRFPFCFAIFFKWIDVLKCKAFDLQKTALFSIILFTVKIPLNVMRENSEVNYGFGSVKETHKTESVAETGYKWKEKWAHLKKILNFSQIYTHYKLS